VVNGYDVHLVKGAGAVWAFSHPVADAILDALPAEEVSAGFEGRVLEVFVAY
jgi:hypothetical protein